jgi:uncharacterized membrane protein
MMSKSEHMDVLIAIYLFEDLGRKDYDAIMDLVEEKAITVQGVVLATKDEHGEMQVIEAGDHAVRKGATMLGGAGLVVGLFAPPLLAATAVGAGIGAVAGKFAKHRVASGIGEKLDDVLPSSSAALIAIYDSGDADKVNQAIPNAIRSSVAQIDSDKAKELKEGLEQASAGLSS